MGSSFSCYGSRRKPVAKHFVVNPAIQGQGESVVKTCELLGIDKHDLDTLWRSFQRFDADGGGEISLDEFIVGCHLEICEAFARLVFRMFDSDHSGLCNFEEFLVSTWNLCSSTTETLAIFSFALFDIDGSGELEGSEINFMASLMHDFRPLTNVLLALEHLQKTREDNESRNMSLGEYLDEVQRAEVLLMPATEMQLLLMKATLGTSAWDRHQDLRRARHGKQTIFEILSIPHDEAALMKVRGLSHVRPPEDSHTRLGTVVADKLERARRMAQGEKDRLARKAAADAWGANHHQRHAHDTQRTRDGHESHGSAPAHARKAAPPPPGHHLHDPAGPHAHHHNTHNTHASHANTHSAADADNALDAQVHSAAHDKPAHAPLHGGQHHHNHHNHHHHNHHHIAAAH